MFKNYLLVALRSLWRQKTYSFINVFGFAIGLAVCLIISFYVIDDLTYDRFHQDAHRIYHLLTLDSSEADGALAYSITSGPLAAGMAENVPEVAACTRLSNFGQLGIRLQSGDTPSPEDEIVNARAIAADSSFFDVFSFGIERGNATTPLANLKGVYITQNLADRIFPDGTEAVGQPIPIPVLEDAFVAGIIAEVPTNSHLQFDMLIPLDVTTNPVWWNSWENLALIGYFKLHPGTNPDEALRKIETYAREGGFADVFKPGMQPLLDVHLGSEHLRYDFMNTGKNDHMKVYTLGIIAILVLLIASINFINLSSARAARRAREVGLRKVVGGMRKQLIMQFLGESLLITLLAMILAITMFELALPYLNNFLQKQLSFNLIQNYRFSLMIFGISIVVGLLAGIYPALVLSSFNPVHVLQGSFSTSSRGILLRRILVIGQFAVSIALIISVFIVLDQINFLNSVDLGYNRDNVITIRNFAGDQTDVVAQRLRTLPYVKAVGTATNLPGRTMVRLEVVPEGSNDKGAMLDRLRIDEHLADVLSFSIVEGRNFSADFPGDPENSVLINQSAAEAFGWANPIGKRLTMIDENEARLQRTVIGVVKDFNFTTARRKVNPMVLPHSGQIFDRFMIKLQPGTDAAAALQEITTLFQELAPETPFNPFFLNDIFNFQFRQDRTFATNIAVFSILAILVACLGLFGLASFTIQQRYREIAVRKVLGSPLRSIVGLLMKEFTRWVIIANCIAWPLAWFFMRRWLSHFVYQTPIKPAIFIISGCLALVIAAVTISAQTIKAALLNPVEALKYE
jgi:putative ABC transport system permease protein